MQIHKEEEDEYKCAPEMGLLLQPAVSQLMQRSSGCVKAIIESHNGKDWKRP